MLRKPIVTLISFMSIAAFLGGCSSGNSADDDDDDDDGSSVNEFVFTNPGVVLPSGTEKYYCFFRDVPTGETASDAVGAVEYAYTPGSAALHHIVIFSASSSEGDTERECDLLENNWNPRYAGGTATDPLVMPDGVAMPVDDVEHVVIQFHYTNATGAEVTDTTSVRIRFTEPGESFTEAGLVVSGQTNFEIPAGAVDHPIVGQCEIPSQVPIDVNIFAIWPHMHQYGTWFTIEGTVEGVTSTWWDEPWDFSDQPLRVLDTPIVVGSGDVIDTVCSYTNPDQDTPITYGESSFQEMCFDFFFYYPSLYEGALPCITN